ncbi:MAG TPA: hypothetical protein VIE65_01595 [Methylobacter sp.]
MDPTSLPTIGSAVGLVKDVVEQVKPSRAPYLLAASVGALFVEISLVSDMTFENKALVIFPVFVFIFVLAILTFYFKPFDEETMAENQESVKIDIDTHQTC